MRLTLALALAVLAPAASAQVVQPAWPLDSGTMIRVKDVRLGATFLRGTLTSTTPDSITVRSLRAREFVVGLDRINSVQVLTESHTAKARYTMIGLLVGAVGGAILGAATYSEPKCDNSVSFCIAVFDRGSTAALAAVVTGAAGALVGFIAGASPKETWVSVPVPSR